jgi:hypothetical protein
MRLKHLHSSRGLLDNQPKIADSGAFKGLGKGITTTHQKNVEACPSTLLPQGQPNFKKAHSTFFQQVKQERRGSSSERGDVNIEIDK